MLTRACMALLPFTPVPWPGSQQVRFINPTPPERQEWLLYAFGPSERPVVGVRQREWQAIADSELGVVREMARCLQEIAAGRVPK